MLATCQRGMGMIDRRTLLKASAIGITGYGVGSIATNQPVRASVNTETFSVADDSATTQDGTISDVTLSLAGTWEYNVPSGKDPETWNLSLVIEHIDILPALKGGAFSSHFRKADDKATRGHCDKR